MVKVRIELVADFGPRRGQVVSGVVVESNYDSLLKSVQNKLQLKKKDAEIVTLCCSDFTGLRALPKGDLSEILSNGAKVVVCHGAPAELCQPSEGCSSELKVTKKVQKAIDQLQLVNAGTGCLSARGRPNLEALAAMQHFKSLTGVVTLLRHDEGMCAAASIGQACERLGLKWCHAPLAGPKEMGMIGNSKAKLTKDDFESFQKILQVKEWLASGNDKVVVHCAAGLHRTGIFLYILLRVLGESSERALAKIQQMRQATFDEFIRLQFQAKAEAIFDLIAMGPGSDGNASAMLLLEVVTDRHVPEASEAEEEEDEELAEDDDVGESAK